MNFLLQHPRAISFINLISLRGAARKGKRIERARQNRLKASSKRKLEPQTKQKKFAVKTDTKQFRFLSESQLEAAKPEPPEDNVYFIDKYKKRLLSFEDIITFHKQAVHENVFNQPDALVTAIIELNVKMNIKKKKYIEHIDSTVSYPHPFTYQTKPRKIVALSHKPEDIEAANAAGAYLAGGADIVAQLKSKQLTQQDFEHIVCHSDFLIDFASVKGMKAQKYFPTKQRGNFGNNLGELVNFFRFGVDYSLKKDPDNQSSGMIECYFGRLNMSEEVLRDNLIALFKSVSRFKPLNLADNKQFFERVGIATPATNEVFMLKFWQLTDEYQDPTIQEELKADRV